MIKAVTISLSLALLVGGAPSLFSQTSPAQVAGDEAVRRQAYLIELRKSLATAQEAEAQMDYLRASQLYEEAYDLSLKTGPGAHAEQQQTVTGLSSVRLILAEQAQKKKDFAEADRQLTRVLRVEPKNLAALELKAANDKLLEEQRGMIPSRETRDRIPEIKEERIGTSTLVQDARLLVEMGKLDEAEVLLQKAVTSDPEHQGAFYYLNYIKEARHAQESRKREIISKDKLLQVEKAWNIPLQRNNLPSPNPFAQTNLVHTSPHRRQIMQLLDLIVIEEFPRVEGRGPAPTIPLAEALRELDEQVRERDPAKRGINFIINSQVDQPQEQAQFGQIDPVTGQQLPPPPPSEPLDLRNDVVVTLDPPLRNVRAKDIIDALSKVGKSQRDNSPVPLKFSIEDYAIVFTQSSTEQPHYYTRVFRVNPNTFMEGLQSIAPQFLGTGGGGGGGAGGGGAGGGGGGGGVGGGGAGGGGGGSFAFPRGDLTGASSGGGLGGGGLGGGAGGGGGGGIGGGGGGIGGGGGGIGGGGGGIGGGAGGGGIGGGVGIRGVTYESQTDIASTLARNFFAAAGVNFPPSPFANQGGLGGAGGGLGGGGGGGFTQPGGAGGQFGGLGGIPGQQQVPLKSLFFNDRTGIIFARATLEDLDIMEQAIQVLNVAPPQVNIEARFTEIGQNDSRALGFDWFLGNSLLNNGAIGVQGGTAPSYQGNPSAANPSGTFPGTATPGDAANPNGTLLPSNYGDTKLTTGLGNVAGLDRLDIPTVATVTGILTDPQFRMVIRALEQRSGTDVLSAPNVTTLSGRQAKIEVTELRTIVSGQGFSQAGAGGGGAGVGGAGGVVGGGAAVAAASNFGTQEVPLGPSLDVVPYVSADGYSIQMTLIPTLVEFLGYDDPGPFLPVAQSAAGNTLGTPLTAQLPLPKFRVRQVVTSANVWDGQTIVLGGLIAENVSKIKDKVPVLGDIPLLGRFFRSESFATSKKNLVIFVTPKIIDPAGNRVHTDDNLPYDPNVSPSARMVPIR